MRMSFRGLMGLRGLVMRRWTGTGGDARSARRSAWKVAAGIFLGTFTLLASNKVSVALNNWEFAREKALTYTQAAATAGYRRGLDAKAREQSLRLMAAGKSSSEAARVVQWGEELANAPPVKWVRDLQGARISAGHAADPGGLARVRHMTSLLVDDSVWRPDLTDHTDRHARCRLLLTRADLDLHTGSPIGCRDRASECIADLDRGAESGDDCVEDLMWRSLAHMYRASARIALSPADVVVRGGHDLSLTQAAGGDLVLALRAAVQANDGPLKQAVLVHRALALADAGHYHSAREGAEKAIKAIRASINALIEKGGQTSSPRCPERDPESADELRGTREWQAYSALLRQATILRVRCLLSQDTFLLSVPTDLDYLRASAANADDACQLAEIAYLQGCVAQKCGRAAEAAECYHRALSTLRPVNDWGACGPILNMRTQLNISLATSRTVGPYQAWRAWRDARADIATLRHWGEDGPYYWYKGMAAHLSGSIHSKRGMPDRAIKELTDAVDVLNSPSVSRQDWVSYSRYLLAKAFLAKAEVDRSSEAAKEHKDKALAQYEGALLAAIATKAQRGREGTTHIMRTRWGLAMLYEEAECRGKALWEYDHILGGYKLLTTDPSTSDLIDSPELHSRPNEGYLRAKQAAARLRKDGVSPVKPEYLEPR